MGKQNRKIRGAKPAAVTAKAPEQQVEARNLKYIVWALLAFIFILSLYTRAELPYDTIFVGDVVAFASDDAVYQMRLVENTIKTFPQRISYDPWTYYPYGSSIHFGPLMSQMIAGLAIIAGFIFDGGAPSQRTIDVVGAYFPAVMGALVVFPTYLIARNLSNRFGGLLSAFLIAVLPGQFLQRSLLGFTDHHVLETLFSTLTIAFFILAVKKARDSGVRYSHIRNKDLAVLRMPLAYSVLAGISYAAYQLAWPAASMMGGIIVIGSIVVAIFEHLRRRQIDHVVIPGTVMFMVALLLILPYIDFSRGFESFFLSWFHITVTTFGALAFVILAVVARELDKRGYAAHYYPLALGLLALVEIIILRLALPSFYSIFMGLLSIVTQRTTGGASTISEAMSMFYENFGYGPVFTFVRVYDDFTFWGFWFAIVGLAVLAFDMLKKGKEEKVIVFFWSLIMLSAIYAQVRFSYYFAVNVAVLGGYFVSRMSDTVMNFAEWKGVGSRLDGIRSPDDLHTFILDNVRLQHVLAILLIVLVSYLLLSTPYGKSMDEGRYGSGAMRGYFPWYEAATWMRENTPSFEKDLPYYGVYKKPPTGEKYPYPGSAYGVMSWWDYGHVITYRGHRIPNANPFQSGIGGGPSSAPGASTFLTAQTEDEANRVLDALGTNGKPGARYVVSDAYMAYAIQDVFSIWAQLPYSYYEPIEVKQGGKKVVQYVYNEKFYNTMESKLHIFDASGLKHYRLVFESSQGGVDWGEPQNKNLYNMLYGGNLDTSVSGYVKVFEYVKGARITGKAQPNQPIDLSVGILTNYNRAFTYTQTTESDASGNFVFTVPYSTTGPVPGETQFAVHPTGPYSISSGGISKQVEVNERSVLDGGEVRVDLA